MTDTNFENMYGEYQQLTQQFQQAEQQTQQIDAQLQEFAVTMDAINELPRLEDSNDMLVPLSSGIFLKTKLADKNTVVLNVGADVAVEKNIKDAKKLIEEQVVELTKFKAQNEQNKLILQARLQEIQAKLQE